VTGSTYQAPAWLPGGHAQTIYAYYLPRAPIVFKRERVATPDGDFVDFDWLEGEHASASTQPVFVLFHGLEGSSRSHYAIACAREAKARGWAFVVPHFRGCSGEPNATVRSYHSGDVGSIEFMLETVANKTGNRPICAAGISLGGNALTKFCGTTLLENPAAHVRLMCAASVCAPLDLGISGERIAKGFNMVYANNFLRTMKRNAKIKSAKFPGTFDVLRAQTAKTMADFDDAYTAPVHGFSSVTDYYQRASSRQNLIDIALPFLLIHALNDPFVPDYLAPKSSEVSPSVTLDLPASGGHVGFVSGAFPGNLNWLPNRLMNFFEEHLL
jgi:uncharacterized protein